MERLKLNEKYIKPAALAETAIFFSLVLLFFLPIDIPHKLAFPVFTLFIRSTKYRIKNPVRLMRF